MIGIMTQAKNKHTLAPTSPLPVVLLTGCASGIGQHLAQVFAAQGHPVIATDINIDALEAYAHQMQWEPERILTRKLDVRDADAWCEIVALAVDTWGQLDILCNIAGYLHPGYIDEASLQDIHLHLDINTKGVILGTQAAARQMVKQGHGHIINVASLAGIAPTPGLSLYTASKFAVRGFSLAAALELRASGVSVTVLCPDSVHTPMLDLQKGYKEAAMSFSAAPLSIQDVEQIIVKHVLVKKPLEATLPAARGWLAKLGSAFPSLLTRGGAKALQKGLLNQQRHRMHSAT